MGHPSPMNARSTSIDGYKTQVFAVEGNIGVGKSTLIERLKKLCDSRNLGGVVVIAEPVEEWVDNGFLKGMYDGSITKGEFQQMVLMSLAGKLLEALAQKPRPAVIITERSPWSNYHVFGKANLVGESLKLYHYTWLNLLKAFPSNLDVHYVYLSATPDVIMSRMRTRGREEESTVPVEYIQEIHRRHEEWFRGEGSLSEVNTAPIAIIDALPEEQVVWRALCRQISVWLTRVVDDGLSSKPVVQETLAIASRAIAMAKVLGEQYKE